MVKKQPFVSVIVPTLDEEKNIEDCLESLLNLDYPEKKYEIIVVDGGSEDKTVEIAKKYQVKVLHNKKKNAAAGRNIGIKNSMADLVAFTDADCVVSKKWLKVLVSNISEKVSCVGGPSLTHREDYFSTSVSYVLTSFFGSAGSAQSYVYKEKTFVPSLPNTNALYWKKSIESAGFYDETFETGQDAELNYRIQKSGGKFLFVPEAKVWHRFKSTPKKFARRMFQYGFARAKFMKKHKTPLRIWYILVALFSIFVILSPALIYLFNPLVWVYTLYFGIILVSSILSGKPPYYTGIFLSYLIEHFFYGLGFVVGVFR